MMKYMLTSIVFLGLLAGCTTQPATSRAETMQETAPPALASASEPARQQQTTAFDAVTLSRSPCFGKCPVYSVTVHADGRVEYDGSRWVSVTGERHGQANMDAFKELASAIEARRIPLIVDYRPGKPACAMPVTTDMPGATITIRKNHSTRTLYYYEGCRNVPDWLPQLAEQIDRAAVSGRWVGGGQATEILRAPDH